MPNRGPVLTTGSYSNPAGTTISGTGYGVQLTDAGTVQNAGSINASNGNGVMVDGVGFVTNTTLAAITGSVQGVYIGGAGNIYNSGVISGTITGAYVKGVGIIDNYANALFSGSSFGLDITGAGTVKNLGGISASNGIGIYTSGVGIVSNSLNGVITGASFGLDFFKSAGTVINEGIISSANGGAAYIGGYGTVSNAASIIGNSFGVDINAGGSVLNAGTISASNGSGVSITGTAFVTNSVAAVIKGTSFGVDIVGPGIVTNAGLIAASGGTGINADYTIAASDGTGISVLAAGDITNLAHGTISGTLYGIDMLGAATVTNAGTISGATGAVGGAVVFSLAVGDLIVDPGAVFKGNVKDISGGGIIELTAGTPGSFGTLDMGSSFSGFTAVNFDAGSSWLVAGDGNDIAGGQAISGFVKGDTIDVQGFAETSYTFVAGIGLELSKGAVTETLDISGPYTTDSFGVTVLADGATQVVICYLRGTKILTPAGEIAIEALNIGDPVITRFNGYQPIKWIGEQHFDPRFAAKNRDVVPVRIKPGALGNDLPARDLYVSPGHSLLVGKTLLLAKNLVNGITITQDEFTSDIHYYLIELEKHDCVIAEGTWAESYADGPGLRDKFQNVASFVALYPDYVTPAELHLCAPRPEHGPALDIALRPVVARARAGVAPGQLRGNIERIETSGLIEGWAQDMENPELPVLLNIMLDDQPLGSVLACGYRVDLAQAGLGSGRCLFSFAGPELSAADWRRISVCRAEDGARIPCSDDCAAKAA
jgi:hypothetical protein